jgi:hypothetical protein
MKSWLRHVPGGIVTITFLTSLKLFAQGPAFTYQRQLTTNGQPANGNYDFQFRLYDAPTSGNQVPVSPLSPNVIVSNGLFTTAMDFGNNVFTGTLYWLEIAVQPHELQHIESAPANSAGTRRHFRQYRQQSAREPAGHAIKRDGQGLNQKLEQKETEITELKQKNDSLERRLAALEKTIGR